MSPPATVSALALGTANLPPDPGSAEALVAEAAELGITTFDTADRYGGDGAAERMLGRALRGRAGVTLITKTAAPPPGQAHVALRSACRASAGSLGRSPVDVYLLHDPTPAEVASGELQAAMVALREDGLARRIGVSALDATAATMAVEAGCFDAVQIRYHILEQETLARVGPAARRAGLALFLREPLAGGLLSGRYPLSHRFPADDPRSRIPAPVRVAWAGMIEALREFEAAGRPLVELALRFCLDREAASVVCGARHRTQLQALAAVREAPPLGAAEQRRIFELLLFGAAAPGTAAVAGAGR